MIQIVENESEHRHTRWLPPHELVLLRMYGFELRPCSWAERPGDYFHVIKRSKRGGQRDRPSEVDLTTEPTWEELLRIFGD